MTSLVDIVNYALFEENKLTFVYIISLAGVNAWRFFPFIIPFKRIRSKPYSRNSFANKILQKYYKWKHSTISIFKASGSKVFLTIILILLTNEIPKSYTYSIKKSRSSVGAADASLGCVTHYLRLN